jgi:hypothetical protein
MPINIHIEHLVVEGSPFAASDAAAFRTALERELAAVAAAATDAAGWPPARRTSLPAPANSPAQPSHSTWAADSARSLIAAVTPATC